MTEDQVESRVLPHSLDAEGAILSAVMVDPDAFPKVATVVKRDDFYADSHRRIYEACEYLASSGKPIDVVQVATRLRDTDRLSQVGGMAYVTEVLNTAPSVHNVVAYAEIVARKARVRKLILVCQRVVAQGYQPVEDEDAFIDHAESSVHDVSAERRKTLVETMKSALLRVFKKIQESDQRQGQKYTGITTGLVGLDDMMGGLQKGEQTVIAARPGVGKAQPMGAKVLTAQGWSTMGDLRVGDLVIGGNGKPVRVIAVHERGDLEVYRVSFTDGASTECCADHLWFTRTRADRRRGLIGGVKSTRDIMSSMFRCDGGKNHSVQYAGKSEFSATTKLPLHPYVLGAWLGDGHRANLHNPEKDLRDKFASLLPKTDCLRICGPVSTRIKRRPGEPTNETVRFLRNAGLYELRAENKFVPDMFLTAGIRDRLHLLQGLCDTDGFVPTSGVGKCVEYVTVSPMLRDAVVFLVGSLGGRCTWVEKKTHYTYLGKRLPGQLAYRMILSFPNNDTVPVSSKKHMAKWNRGDHRLPERFIASVSPVGVKQCRCITVDSDDGLYVTDDFIVTHNSALMSNVAVHVAAQKYGVIIFSLEMPNEQLAIRALCSAARVDVRKARVGAFDAGDLRDIMNAIGPAIEPVHFYLVDTPCSLMDVRSICRARAADMARDGCTLGLVCVDFAQLMDAKEGIKNREEAVSVNARGLKMLAKEIDAHVMLLSQLNRGVEARADKRPMLSDLKESGALEESADAVIGIYRDEYYDAGTKTPGIAELIILKHRHGPTGTVEVGFHAQSTTFHNLEQEYT